MDPNTATSLDSLTTFSLVSHLILPTLPASRFFYEFQYILPTDILNWSAVTMAHVWFIKYNEITSTLIGMVLNIKEICPK